jgi:hypothetical protein
MWVRIAWGAAIHEATLHLQQNGKIVWTLAGLLMLTALLWPALWNGFPIVFYDTGGYLARPFEMTLAMGRSALYGAFLALGIKEHFWPNIIVQAAIVAWLIALTLRLQGFGGRPWLATALVIGLCALTGLSWYASQLTPDILVSVFVLALAMLAFHAQDLRRPETIILIVAIAVAIASHMSILALALGLTALLAVLGMFATRINLPQPAVALPAVAVATGVLLAPLSNFIITKQLAFTPGGFNFVFGGLLQDGIVERYLADRCPNPTIRLCSYRAEVPRTADVWLWAEESPIYKLGGFEQFETEARRIVIESVMRYPAMSVRAAFIATIKQFADIATGDGLTPWSWHTQWTFERFAAGALKPYLASRQARMTLDFSWANLIHIPVQALAIAALPVIVLLGRGRDIAAIAALVFVALIGNSVICGVLSNPHDRYQSRLAWLAPLIVAVAALSWHRHSSTEAVSAGPA